MPAAHFFAASPEAVGIDPDKLDHLFTRAEQEVRDGLLPSVQVAVARQGKLAGMHSYGHVTHEGRHAAVTNGTLYVIFSATKAITASAIWLLIQEGKLRIDERVAEIIPEFGSNGKEHVSVEQLLTHTAGFPYAPFSPTDWPDRARRLDRFRRWRLNWEPGSRFEYHPTSSMWVLAEILERRGGMDFRQFMRKRIAEPLGLHDLYVGLPREIHGRLADIVHVGEALSPDDLRALGLPVVQNEVTEDALQGFNQSGFRLAGVPGGGGTMTAGDLALFYQALLADGRAYDGTPIWEPSVLRMAREIRTGDLTDPIYGKRVNRGLGIIIAGDEDRIYRGFGRANSAAAFGHNGAGGQLAWADPETGLSFAYCTNGLDRHPLRVARRSVALSSRAASCLLVKQ